MRNCGCVCCCAEFDRWKNIAYNEVMHYRTEDLLTSDTIFVSPFGSRLYNLHEEDSDYDFISVELSKKSRHSVVDGLDIKRVSMYRLLKESKDKASHTVLEALYSQQKVLGPKSEYLPMLEGMRFPFLRMAKAFQGVAKDAMTNNKPEKDLKRIRLGLYLIFHCLAGASKHPSNYYNPTVSDKVRKELTELAKELLPYTTEERVKFAISAVENVVLNRYKNME